MDVASRFSPFPKGELEGVPGMTDGDFIQGRYFNSFIYAVIFAAKTDGYNCNFGISGRFAAKSNAYPFGRNNNY